MKKYFWLIFLFVFNNLILFAGNNSVTDSLENCLKKAKEDTNKVKILDDLSWNYSSNNLEKALEYAQIQLNLSEKLKYPKGEANAYVNLGSVYYYQNNFPVAIKYFNNAYKIRLILKDNAGAAGLINNIGMICKLQGNYPEALNSMLKALKIFENLDDSMKMASVYNNVGIIYQDLKNYPLSLSYLKKAMVIREKLNDNESLSGTYLNIGNDYQLLRKDLLALRYYNKALELQKSINDKYTIARILNSIAGTYKNQNKIDLAMEYFEKSNAIKKEINDVEGLISGNISLGEMYLNQNKPVSALKLFKEALIIADSTGSRDNLKYIYIGMVKSYKQLHDYENSLVYFFLYDQIKDTLLNETSTKQIAEMQTRYETEKKEIENIRLQKENEIKQLKIAKQENEKKYLIYLFSIIGLIVIMLSVFIIYRNKLRQKSELFREQNRQQKLQFKAVIEAEEKERKRIAQELHDGLGQLLSTAKMNIASLDDAVSESDEEDKSVFNNSLELIDEAVSEVRNISHNLMPGALIKLGLVPAINELVKKINTAGQISIELICNDDFKQLNETSGIIIYRIIQEILNNTIRHSEAKNVKIEILHLNGKLNLNISDNGRGMELSKIGESNGIGWKNIYSRVNMLNGNMEIKSEIGKGTKIFIALNIDLKE